MKYLQGFSVILFFTVSLQAQVPQKEKLDSFFQALETHNKFMGSVALMDKGQLLYQHSLGWADVATGQKIDANTTFRIGSISKTFTTVLIFKAIEDQKLSLQDPLAKWFPKVVNANKITIEDLLRHRSGIFNFTNDSAYETYNTRPRSREEMVNMITAYPSDFEPGTKFNYSNSAFVLLTLILEDVFGKRYPELVQKKIIKPLHLKRTAYGGKVNSGDNEALPYQYQEKWALQTETDMSIPLGAGALISTPADLCRFADALFNGRLISPASLQQMTTLKENVGMGIFAVPYYESNGFGHTGGIDTYRSFLCYFPREKRAFAYTSNASNYDNNSITVAVLNAYSGKPFTVPEFKELPITEAELDQYLGTYKSADIPLKITFTKNKNKLISQATGQPAFELQHTGEHQFSAESIGVVIRFLPAEKKFSLKQGGREFVFEKE